jgi:leader peptidase (prepilin peptidase)/N-methyltransferase
MIPRLAETTAMFPWLMPALAFVLGAAIGSFLNVVILRLPAGRSVVSPGSHCACGQPIAPRDNVPILSWVLRRGRARCCGRPFSVRYPAVELLTALLFLAAAREFAPAAMVCAWVFLGALVAATFIDIDTLQIPDTFTIGLAGAGVVLSALVPALHGEQSGFYALDSLRSCADGLQGLLLGSGLLLWIAVLGELALKKEAVGFGDIKLVGAIGVFCGWHGAVFAIFGGAVAGTLGLLAAMAWRRTARLGLGKPVPFGPMLALAGAAYFLFLHGKVDAWFATFSGLF